MKTLALLVVGAVFMLPSLGGATGLNGGTTSGDLQLSASVSALDAFGAPVSGTGYGAGEKVSGSFFGGSLFSFYFHQPFHIFDHDFKKFKDRCPPPIPEPNAAAVFGLGALMVAAATRRRPRS